MGRGFYLLLVPVYPAHRTSQGNLLHNFVVLNLRKTLYYHIYWNIRQGFPLQNNPKKLDLSNKTDLDFWTCFGREKPL